jgi:hypothetical protein
LSFYIILYSDTENNVVMVDHVVKTSIVLLVFASLFLIGPVTAAINTITSGSIVFIGEDGLDITGAMSGDSRIGWWASGASIATSPPDYLIPISNPGNFYISPSDFQSRTGPWYRLNSSGNPNGPAFTVVDPRLDLKIEDTTVGVDVTDKWVPTGDSIRFRIETNLVSISQRPGVSSTPITIKVQSPDGAVYTSLVNNAGISTSTVDIPVTSTPYFTDSIWDTGRVAMYPTGTYTIWAECNVNFMNDRYGEVGKTMSRQISLLDQDQNPLYHPTTLTTNPTTGPTVLPTTQTTVSQTTQITSVPTSVPPPASSSETTISPAIPSPTSTQTKSPGFGGVLAGGAIIIGLVLHLRKG